MLIGIVFCGVALLARLAVHLDEGVLGPSPCGLSVVGEDEVPVVIFVAAIAQVVAEQEERVLAGTPVHGAVATLALAHHEAQLRIALFELWQVLAAFPLGGNAFDVGSQGGVVEDLLHIVQSVGVEGAYPQFYLRMLLAKGGGQVLIVEAQGAFCCPGTTGVGGIAVGLVLIHDLGDGQALFGIEVDEATEHVGIALQIAWILNEVVLCGQTTWKDTVVVAHELHLVGVHSTVIEQIVFLLGLFVIRTAQHAVVLVDLHPCWRTPRTHE